MAGFTSLAIGMIVAGAATKAVGDWRSGGAAMRAGEGRAEVAEDEAQIAEFNAAVADLQAKDAIERGAEEESRFRSGVRDLVGKQRTGYASAGIDVGYGSAVDVQADAAFLGELDARTIRTNAMREAWGYQVQGSDLRRRAEIARKEGVQALEAGRAARSAARIGAIGGLIGAGGSLYAQHLGMADTQGPAGGGGGAASNLYSGFPSSVGVTG